MIYPETTFDRKVDEALETMTSKQAVILLLQEGWTSPMDALRDAGTMKLSTRVSELRKEGYDIESRRVEYRTRFGRMTHYNEYRIKKEEATK